MALPDLCLAPYDVDYMAESENLCAPALERVRVESGAYAGSYLVRTFNNGNGFDSVVARRESLGASLIYISDFVIPDWSLIAGKIERGEVYRYVYFDSDYHLTSSVGKHHFELSLGNEGLIHWLIADSWRIRIRRAGQDENYRHGVTWDCETPVESIERDIQQLLNEEDSSFAFAHHWVSLGWREQEKRYLLFANGDVEELKRWIRGLVGGLGKFDPNMKWELRLKIRMRSDFESDDDYLDDIVGSTQLVSRAGEFRLSANNSLALKELLRYFYPHRSAALQDELEFHGVDYQAKENPMAMSFVVPIPTAHDRLEAQLLLRAFLRGKVSPDELAELMGEH